MAKATKGAEPSKPTAGAYARSQGSATAGFASKDPATWGLAENLTALKTSANIRPPETKQDRYGRDDRYQAAERLDAFSNLRRAGKLTEGQHQAAKRLMTDWAERMGVQTRDAQPGMKVSAPGSHELVTQRMIDAGRRIDGRGDRERGIKPGVLRLVGPSTAQLLAELVDNVVLEREGITTWWRGRVQRVTAEGDKAGQGAIVRQACEDLRLAYASIDGVAFGEDERSQISLWFAPDNP